MFKKPATLAATRQHLIAPSVWAHAVLDNHVLHLRRSKLLEDIASELVPVLRFLVHHCHTAGAETVEHDERLIPYRARVVEYRIYETCPKFDHQCASPVAVK